MGDPLRPHSPTEACASPQASSLGEDFVPEPRGEKKRTFQIAEHYSVWTKDRGPGQTVLKTPALALSQTVGVKVQALEQNTLQRGEEKGGRDAFHGTRQKFIHLIIDSIQMHEG